MFAAFVCYKVLVFEIRYFVEKSGYYILFFWLAFVKKISNELFIEYLCCLLCSNYCEVINSFYLLDV